MKLMIYKYNFVIKFEKNFFMGIISKFKIYNEIEIRKIVLLILVYLIQGWIESRFENFFSGRVREKLGEIGLLQINQGEKKLCLFSYWC